MRVGERFITLDEDDKEWPPVDGKGFYEALRSLVPDEYRETFEIHVGSYSGYEGSAGATITLYW